MDLVGKRLEILKEAIPRAHRVLLFYDPSNHNARQNVTLTREAARQLRIEVVERHVRSVEELRTGLRDIS